MVRNILRCHRYATGGPAVIVCVLRDDVLICVKAVYIERRELKYACVVRISADPGEITIEDDGPGIAAEHWSKVLERGGRLDERGGGAGSALSIAQDVLEACGWELSFGSRRALEACWLLFDPRRETALVS